MLYRQIPPNIQLNWIKIFYRAKQKQEIGEKVQEYKDGSGLQFIKFDLVTGGQQIVILTLQFILLCVYHFWRSFLPFSG